MTDVLYWTTRAALVMAWLLVGWRSWQRRAQWRGLWIGAAMAAMVFASMRAWPWNYWLLEAARAGLRAIGVYDERIWFKALLAVALFLAMVFATRRIRRLAHDPVAFGCCLGLGLQALLLVIETLSLDDLLPNVIERQPGRYLTEGSCVTIALVSLACSKSLVRSRRHQQPKP